MNRLPSLDGWRGVAIALVLGSHISFMSNCPPALGEVCAAVFNGNLGVRIFFTLSGFLITWLLLKEHEATGKISILSFYVRRGWRILPVYVSYLFLILLLQVGGRVDESPSSWLGSLTFTRNVFGRGDSATVHLWSLAIEWQFYLLWPWILMLILRGKKGRLAMGAVVTVFVLASIWLRHLGVSGEGSLVARLNGERSLLKYGDGLLIGAGAAYLWRSRSELCAGRLWGVVGLLLLVVPECVKVSGALSDVTPALQAAGFAMLMLHSLTQGSLLYHIVNHAVLRGLGLISYSLYVWHFLFIDHFAPAVMPWDWLNHYLLWLFPAFVAGWLSWRWIECPTRDWARHRAAHG